MFFVYTGLLVWLVYYLIIARYQGTDYLEKKHIIGFICFLLPCIFKWILQLSFNLNNVFFCFDVSTPDTDKAFFMSVIYAFLAYYVFIVVLMVAFNKWIYVKKISFIKIIYLACLIGGIHVFIFFFILCGDTFKLEI